MDDSLFYYLIPEIYPVFPKESGKTIVIIGLQDRLDALAVVGTAATISVKFELFEGGALRSEEIKEVSVSRGGTASTPSFERDYTLTGIGFVVISIDADAPIFAKSKYESNYAMVMRPDGSFYTLNPQYKAAVGIIIDQIRETQKFCLVQQAHFIDSDRNIGNSTLMVNPYTGPIVVTAVSARGRKVKEKIPPRSAKLLPIGRLIEEREISCVMYSANNRFLGWDVRHAKDNACRINRVDHLEYYRANSTLRHGTLRSLAGAKLRRIMRRGGFPA